MIFLLLIVEFFKIGFFSFGGGYATVPFLLQISEIYKWYSTTELSQMLAIASITPGPVGINVATYSGFMTAGIFGAICATFAEVLPAFFIVIAVSKILKNFKNNFWVKSIIESLKPISCALLCSVALDLIKSNITDYKSVILFISLVIVSWKSKKDPIFYIIISAIVGIIIKYLLLHS